MPKLNDTHTLLLAHAAGRDSGSFYPMPDALAGAARATKALGQLVTFGLAAERETTEQVEVGRADGDIRYGLFITEAGCAAIGVASAGEPSAAEPAAAMPAPAKAPSKTEAVLTLLRRDQGATLPELIEATGWLPHTTRAALTGLRKKGHTIERGKRDEVTCYTIATAAA